MSNPKVEKMNDIAAAHPSGDIYSPDNPDNPNVLAMALQLYKASYRDSKPSDHPALWKLHVDHARKVMKGWIEQPKNTAGAAITATQEEADAAKRAEDLLAGVVVIGGVPVNAPVATKESVSTSLPYIAPAATESDKAKELAIESGLVKPGVFNAPE